MTFNELTPAQDVGAADGQIALRETRPTRRLDAMQTVEDALRDAYSVRDQLQLVVEEPRPGRSSYNMDREARYLRAAHDLPQARVRVAQLEELIAGLDPCPQHAGVTHYPDHRIAEYKQVAVTISLSRTAGGYEPLARLTWPSMPATEGLLLAGDGIAHDTREAALAAGLRGAMRRIDGALELAQ